jgi:hypothetical protein
MLSTQKNWRISASSAIPFSRLSLFELSNSSNRSKSSA